jgi:serine phosphatase RsbU (regulator of sigma subunit)
MKFCVKKKPLSGNKKCGDLSFIKEFDGKIMVAVIDGLGHGERAEDAAVKAVEYLENNYRLNLSEIFHGCNEFLKETVGAAMGIALINCDNCQITFSGVGNIGARVVSDRSFSLTSVFGIVGERIRKVREEKSEFSYGDMIIMYSDGISEKFDVFSYNENVRSDTQRLAEAISNEFCRSHDDSIIVVGH